MAPNTLRDLATIDAPRHTSGPRWRRRTARSSVAAPTPRGPRRRGAWLRTTAPVAATILLATSMAALGFDSTVGAAGVRANTTNAEFSGAATGKPERPSGMDGDRFLDTEVSSVLLLVASLLLATGVLTLALYRPSSEANHCARCAAKGWGLRHRAGSASPPTDPVVEPPGGRIARYSAVARDWQDEPTQLHLWVADGDTITRCAVGDH